MRIAVAILNYNGAELLPRFLPSVIQNSAGAEVWIIDNGSTDQSLNWLNENYPTVRQVRLETNGGFCDGYNNGLKQISADVFVLLNSDVEVTPGWLDKPVEILKHDAAVAAVQPKILSYRARDTFEYAGAGGGFMDLLCYPYCRGRIFDRLETDHGQYNDSCEITWGSGACLFIRAVVFHEHGGFEPSFFAHMEEIDLCWRIRRAGHKIMYCGASTVFHLGGGTLPVSSPRKTYLNFRNNLSLMMRNLRLRDLLLILPARFVLDHVAAIKFFAEGNGASAASVVQAWSSFLIHFRKEIQKRKKVSRWGYLKERNLGKVKWLILERYLKRA
jgi:GT2 family glycosyltransferase